MKHLRWLVISLVITATATAWATIPLIERAAIQLPGNGPWDVQHWMSDSTYGWAQMSGDTVLYQLATTDSVRRCFIPVMPLDSIAGSWFYSYNHHHWHQRITIFRSTDDGSPRALLLTQYQGLHDTEYDMEALSIFSLLNLSQDSLHALLGTHLREALFVNDLGPGSRVSTTIQQMTLWPPPPERSTSLLITLAIHGDANLMGDRSHEWWDGELLFADLRVPLDLRVALEHAVCIDPFTAEPNQRFAVASQSDDYYDDYDGQYYEYHHWASEFFPPSATEFADSIIGLPYVQAQCDASGARRLIVGGPLSVYDANAPYELLWTVSGITESFYSARIAGSLDERLLVQESAARRFRVYDAGNGNVIDHTESLPDSLAYLIKRPAYQTEFVTYNAAQRIVRLYGTDLAGPSGLTCAYLSNLDAVQFRWQPMAGAVSYDLYASSTLDGDYFVAATVPGNLTICTIPRDANFRFFKVVANYTGGTAH